MFSNVLVIYFFGSEVEIIKQLFSTGVGSLLELAGQFSQRELLAGRTF